MARIRRRRGFLSEHLRPHPDPARSAAVVVFQADDLPPAQLAATLHARDRIAVAARPGDRPGLRLSPHFYNQPEEIDRAIAAIRHYLKHGLPA